MHAYNPTTHAAEIGTAHATDAAFGFASGRGYASARLCLALPDDGGLASAACERAYTIAREDETRRLAGAKLTTRVDDGVEIALVDGVPVGWLPALSPQVCL